MSSAYVVSWFANFPIRHGSTYDRQIGSVIGSHPTEAAPKYFLLGSFFSLPGSSAHGRYLIHGTQLPDQDNYSVPSAAA